MSISHNIMGDELKRDLAEFGIFRNKVAKFPGKYFGVKSGGTPSSNIVGSPELGQYVPEGISTTNLLEPEFSQKLRMKDTASIKSYLRRLLESL